MFGALAVPRHILHTSLLIKEMPLMPGAFSGDLFLRFHL